MVFAVKRTDSQRRQDLLQAEQLIETIQSALDSPQANRQMIQQEMARLDELLRPYRNGVNVHVPGRLTL